MPRLIAIAGAVLSLLQAAPAWASHAGLATNGYSFALSLPDGRVLVSRDLVGAVLEMDDPQGRLVTARIDRVTPSKRACRHPPASAERSEPHHENLGTHVRRRYSWPARGLPRARALGREEAFHQGCVAVVPHLYGGFAGQMHPVGLRSLA